MDDIPREMQKFADKIALKGYVQTINTTIPTALDDHEKNCLDLARENMDRFVDCMKKSIKKMSKEEAKFQYRLSFAQSKLQECFTKEFNSGRKDYERCHKEGFDRAEKYVEDFMKNIKQ